MSTIPIQLEGYEIVGYENISNLTMEDISNFLLKTKRIGTYDEKNGLSNKTSKSNLVIDNIIKSEKLNDKMILNSIK